MLLGGEPLGERFVWRNFVSSRRERIEQAKAGWAAGRISLPPSDNAEFVPLPQDKSRPAGSGLPAPAGAVVKLFSLPVSWPPGMDSRPEQGG